jgi:hypothetical protein
MALAEPRSCLLHVQVPRSASTRDITALETAMHGLALDAAHPVALELAATATARHFLLRATTPVALKHLAAQIQARYPQADLCPPLEDPLHLQEGETLAAVELLPGAASYLPLRSWKERELLKEGTDPLLGILAVFNSLPPHVRAVAQLALIPVPATWSRGERRRTVEHPLESERVRQRQDLSAAGSSAPGAPRLVALGVLVAVLLLWLRFSRWITTLLPSWLIRAGAQLMHGKAAQLTAAQMTQLISGGAGMLALLLVFLWLFSTMSSRFGQASIYDMRLVDEKTARLAYRVRLRLFVMAPDAGCGCGVSGERRGRALLRPRRLRAQLPPPQQFSWHYLFTIWQHWRQESTRRRQQVQLSLDVLGALTAAYRQYHTAAGGYFAARSLSRVKAQRLLTRRAGFVRSRLTGWEHDLRSSRHLLSVADLAALWHLPQAQDLADLPYVERGRARTFLVPAALVSGNGWKIGASAHAGHSVPVYLPGECLRHNLLAIASTGKGKSTLFQHLVQAASASGSGESEGLIVVEPHGDLINAITGLLPRSRQDDVVLVDLASGDSPVGINPLDITLGRDRDKAVDNLITIFEHLWAASYGSRTENILEYALKTLVDANETLVRADLQQGPDQQYTLLDVVPLLRRSSFRHAVLEQVGDALLTDWWQSYYEPLDLRQQAEFTSSVITKISKFASSRTARRILGQPRSTIDLGEIVRQGKILLVSTASGVVGADISALIGATLLGLLQVTLAEQARYQAEQRRRFLVLIDEFQVFSGVNYQSMLAELRKYGGSFGLATQSLSYLDRFDRTLRPTVLANVDHIFAFDMAGEDARLLHELDGIEEDDITNLDDFQCYVKLSLGGRRLPVFSLRLDAPPRSDDEQSQRIRRRSQQRDARPAGIVDDMLKQAQARHKQAAPARAQRPGTPGHAWQQEGDTPFTHRTQGWADEGVQTATATARRKKKRGGSGGRKEEGTADLASHLHLMYDGAEAGQDDSDDAQGGNHD